MGLDCLENTKLLPFKLLSSKLAMLLALSCPERGSSLAKLDFRHCRVAPEGVPSHLYFQESEALQINYLQPFLRLFHTTRDSVPLALCTIILKLHRTYVQSFRHPNQTHCLFLMSNHIIQSLRPLLADSCAWS